MKTITHGRPTCKETREALKLYACSLAMLGGAWGLCWLMHAAVEIVVGGR